MKEGILSLSTGVSPYTLNRAWHIIDLINLCRLLACPIWFPGRSNGMMYVKHSESIHILQISYKFRNYPFIDAFSVKADAWAELSAPKHACRPMFRGVACRF